MREEGFYRVKRKPDHEGDESQWEVAEWAGGEWWRIGVDYTFDDSVFSEIDPLKMEID